MWSVKFAARVVIKGYDVLLTGDNTILVYDAEKTKLKGFYELKLLNKTANNDLILAQEDTVCFHIVEEAKINDNNYGDAGQPWMKLSRKN